MSEQLSGTEDTAVEAGSCRYLLKGPCLQVDFNGDGPARFEHQHWVGNTGDTKDLQGDTELSEGEPEVGFLQGKSAGRIHFSAVEPSLLPVHTCRHCHS